MRDAVHRNEQKVTYTHAHRHTKHKRACICAVLPPDPVEGALPHRLRVVGPSFVVKDATYTWRADSDLIAQCFDAAYRGLEERSSPVPVAHLQEHKPTLPKQHLLNMTIVFKLDLLVNKQRLHAALLCAGMADIHGITATLYRCDACSACPLLRSPVVRERLHTSLRLQCIMWYVYDVGTRASP
jgi:hypothetical protein